MSANGIGRRRWQKGHGLVGVDGTSHGHRRWAFSIHPGSFRRPLVRLFSPDTDCGVDGASQRTEAREGSDALPRVCRIDPGAPQLAGGERRERDGKPCLWSASRIRSIVIVRLCLVPTTNTHTHTTWACVLPSKANSRHNWSFYATPPLRRDPGWLRWHNLKLRTLPAPVCICMLYVRGLARISAMPGCTICRGFIVGLPARRMVMVSVAVCLHVCRHDAQTRCEALL